MTQKSQNSGSNLSACKHRGPFMSLGVLLAPCARYYYLLVGDSLSSWSERNRIQHRLVEARTKNISRDGNKEFSGHCSKGTMYESNKIAMGWIPHLAPTILETEKHILDSTITLEGPSNLSAHKPNEGQVVVP